MAQYLPEQSRRMFVWYPVLSSGMLGGMTEDFPFTERRSGHAVDTDAI